ncbi:MAG: WbuC family cupin fold metalloprotein [Gammaproteobacteria bacterium]|nr:WbuC family cupin fold metalloprotein [Gammaproteobacteria bacterium]
MTARENQLSPGELDEVAPGIFYSKRAFVVADTDIVEFLKEQARTNEVGRARVCAHPNAEAEQHDMLIVSHRDTYVAPHRHLSKSESFIVIEGCAKVLIFDESGHVDDVFDMGAASSGLPFFYRMPIGTYHSLDIASEVLVFVESTKGPFRKEDMQSAPWAPSPDLKEAGREFISSCSADRQDGHV